MYIIVPVHNRFQYTKRFLESLYCQTDRSFKVIIVDDGSTDGTAKNIQLLYPDIKILSGDGNLWWTASINLGIKYALSKNPKYILTLNNDTIVPSDFIEKMKYWAKIKPEAILGSLAVNVTTGEVVFAGEAINWKFAKFDNYLDNLDPDSYQGLREVTHLPGRGMLIPVDVINNIGLFDEKNLPHYGADYDFSLRAANYGYDIYCNYDSKLLTYPDESGSVYLRNRKNIKNYYLHLFGIKGGGNLKDFYYIAKNNCPKKYFIPFLFFGFIRRIGGYWLKN